MPRRFWMLWTASTASNLGDGVVLAAIPLLAAQLTASPAGVAAATVAVRLPWLVFGLFAGAIVDRVDRRRAMILADIGRALGFGLLGLLVHRGDLSLEMLYVIVFVMGLLETIFDTAAMTVLPAIVDAGDLERANGRIFAGQVAANGFAGPALGGVLFAVAASIPFSFDAATFAVSAVLVGSLRGAYRPAPRPRRAITREVADGLAFVWREPTIRTFAVGAGVLNLAFAAGGSILVLHAGRNLDLSDAGFGVLLASAAVGAVVGAQSAAGAAQSLGRYRTLLVSVGGIAAGLALLGAAPAPVVAGLGLAMVGFFEEWWSVISVAYRQSTTPDGSLGRVMAGFRVIAYGAFPIGAIAGGTIAEVAGLRVPFFAGAVIAAALLPLIVGRMKGLG